MGSSSAESTLCLEQWVEGQWVKFTEALFVLVARDPLNRGAAFINPLELCSQEERDIFQLGEQNKRRWVVYKPPTTLTVWLQALRDFAGFAVQNPTVAG